MNILVFILIVNILPTLVIILIVNSQATEALTAPTTNMRLGQRLHAYMTGPIVTDTGWPV